MVKGLETFEYFRSRGYRMILITDHVLTPITTPCNAGFFPQPAFHCPGGLLFRGILFRNIHENIEMGKPMNTFEVIQYSIPAGQGALDQGFLIIMYGRIGEQ
jgi:hypothetical protein